MPPERFSLKLYRLLLSFYPAAFREEYGGQLERQFRDELAQAHGPAGVAALWLGILFDLAISVPAQLTREIAQDSRHALRQWARRPLHTGFAIAALAIGIGANTGVFSVVNALLLRPLPFRDPGRLAVPLGFSTPREWGSQQFHDWPKGSAYLEDAAIFDQGDTNLGRSGEALRVHLTETSWNFFSLLGVQPARGRAFAPQEDVAGRDSVAVLGYGLWQQLFAGDPKALGATIQVGGASLTVIGIAPPGFDFPEKTALWTPSKFDANLLPKSAFLGGIILRLKAGMPWAAADAALTADSTRLDPNRNNPANPPSLQPLQDSLVGPMKTPSLILMAAVALILLIACTNVANLLLARTADRAVELSVRAALGASRARLSQQLLTECVLLALVAAAAGLVVADAVTSLANKVQPAPAGAQSYSLLDLHVVAFTVAVSVLCGLLFGVLPSMHAGRTYKLAARGSTALPHSRTLREVLVAVQVMLTIVLLGSSFSIGRAFLNLVRMDRGFDRQGVVTVSMAVGEPGSRGAAALPYYQQAVERVRELPGVSAASLAEFLPLKATAFLGGRFSVDGQRSRENAMIVPVLPDYFHAMGGHIVYGREFTGAEIAANARVAVINDVLAREFGEPASLVGRQLRAGPDPITIIGVVKDLTYIGDANTTQIYVPDHTPGQFFPTIVARVDGRAEDRLAMVRDAVTSVDSQVPVYDLKTMDQLLDDALVRPKFYTSAALFFAGFSLLLAVIGIYGVVSYAITQRSHEMGVRLALGTTPGELRGAMLRQGLITIALGSIPGIAGTVLAGKFIESLIQGSKGAGMEACIVAVLFIAATAAAAIWSATRRVARLDIMEVLRTE